MSIRCFFGKHNYKKTGKIEKIAVFDEAFSYRVMEEYECSRCKKIEWKSI